MNRRDFWMTAGGATALSVLGGRAASLLAREAVSGTTPFFVRGLAMVDFGSADYLTIALPEAPHHAGTVQFTTSGGTAESHAVKGRGRLLGSAGFNPKPDVRVPPLVNVQELYPGASPKLAKSPTIISIPWSAVTGISAETLSEDRWTFVVKDTGEEVITFRPRQVAESLRFDLVSSGVLEMNDGEVSVDLAEVSDVSTEFVPMSDDMGGYTDHFAFYLPYVEIGPNAPEVQPREVGQRRGRSAPIPALANSFAAAGARVWPYSLCFPFRVG